jgi:MFS family permease
LLTSAAGRAAAIIFTASGILTGTLASRWPWLAARLHLSSGVIGVLGLVSSVGALVAMPFAARFVHRYGARAATCVLTVAMGITLVLPPFAPGVVVLAVIFVVMGAAIGTQDNAMNTSAVEAEKEAGKTIMSGLHGMWSIGVLAGALAGSLAARLNVDPRIQFTAMGVLIAAAGLASAPWLAGGPATGPVAENEVPRFVWPRGLILLIGLVGFAAVFVEFAASSWAALFMHWTLHTSQATAALAAALFALAMAAGRLAGNIIGGAVGPTWSVRGCGILATVGCLVRADRPGGLGSGPAGLRRGRPLGLKPGHGRGRRRHDQLRRGPGRAQSHGRRGRGGVAARRVRDRGRDRDHDRRGRGPARPDRRGHACTGLSRSNHSRELAAWSQADPAQGHRWTFAAHCRHLSPVPLPELKADDGRWR